MGFASGAGAGLMIMSRMVGMTFGAALDAVVFDICGPNGASVALFFGAISSAPGMVAGAVRIAREREWNSGAPKLHRSILEYRM
jgi:hypothetical protein